MKSKSVKKTYCILTPQVAGMGGAQLYAIRRVNFLKGRGFRVILFVSDRPDFPLNEKFDLIENICVPELISPVFNFSRDKVTSVLDFIKSKLDIFGEDLIIESHTLSISLWGEMLAEKLHSKHFIYPLNERPLTYWEFLPIKDFFLWKLERTEFIGPSLSSLKVVMDRYFSPEKAPYANIGFDPSELPERSTPDISGLIDHSSFRIGTISRLSKPYIEELIRSVLQLADKYPGKRIDLVIAGDDPDPSILENLRKKYTNTKNLNIIYPGYINKLGRDFFNNLDLFVGMATAAINSISSNCATITVDPISKKSSGFFGLTSKDTMFADANLLFSLIHWIEMAFTRPEILEDARNAGNVLFMSEFLADTCMQKIEDLVASSEPAKVYWEIPDNYITSGFLKFRYRSENSKIYKFLQKIYGFRRQLSWR